MAQLGPFTTDPPGQLDILGHDGHPLGVDGTEVGVLKESHQVSLTSLLESHHSRALEPQVSLEVLSNLTDKTLEGQLADEQLSGLLVPESNNYPFVYIKLKRISHLLISLRATVPGLYRWGFLTPPVAGADFLAALVASCFLQDNIISKVIYTNQHIPGSFPTS